MVIKQIIVVSHNLNIWSNMGLMHFLLCMFVTKIGFIYKSVLHHASEDLSKLLTRGLIDKETKDIRGLIVRSLEARDQIQSMTAHMSIKQVLFLV